MICFFSLVTPRDGRTVALIRPPRSTAAKDGRSTTFTQFRGLRATGRPDRDLGVLALLLARLAVHGRLVDLHVPTEGLAVVDHQLVADLVQHPPRGLVSDANLPLDGHLADTPQRVLVITYIT